MSCQLGGTGHLFLLSWCGVAVRRPTFVGEMLVRVLIFTEGLSKHISVKINANHCVCADKAHTAAMLASAAVGSRGLWFLLEVWRAMSPSHRQ